MTDPCRAPAGSPAQYKPPHKRRKATAALKPPDPVRCWHHDRPNRLQCPGASHSRNATTWMGVSDDAG